MISPPEPNNRAKLDNSNPHAQNLDKPNLLLLQILADYSNDLHTLSKRNGKTPAEAAVARIEELMTDISFNMSIDIKLNKVLEVLARMEQLQSKEGQ